MVVAILEHLAASFRDRQDSRRARRLSAAIVTMLKQSVDDAVVGCCQRRVRIAVRILWPAVVPVTENHQAIKKPIVPMRVSQLWENFRLRARDERHEASRDRDDRRLSAAPRYGGALRVP